MLVGKAENGKVKNSHTRYDEVDNMEESFSSDDDVKENIWKKHQEQFILKLHSPTNDDAIEILNEDVGLAWLPI